MLGRGAIWVRAGFRSPERQRAAPYATGRQRDRTNSAKRSRAQKSGNRRGGRGDSLQVEPITLFTMPKAFRGHIGVIQSNAIRSWARLAPECEIVLYGDDEGTAAAARAVGATHLEHVARNEYGTPLVSDMFEQVERMSSSSRLAYVNTDIILFPDFVRAVRHAPTDRAFVMCGQRWDLELRETLPVFAPASERALRREAVRKGEIHSHVGVDYFVYSRGLYREMPPFAIGRLYYDNWFLYEAKRKGALVVDTTRCVSCIHQNHDRSYASLGMEAPPGEARDHQRALQRGVEAKTNRRLASGPPIDGVPPHRMCVGDADLEMIGGGGLRPLPFGKRLRRYLEKGEFEGRGWRSGANRVLGRVLALRNAVIRRVSLFRARSARHRMPDIAARA